LVQTTGRPRGGAASSTHRARSSSAVDFMHPLPVLPLSKSPPLAAPSWRLLSAMGGACAPPAPGCGISGGGTGSSLLVRFSVLATATRDLPSPTIAYAHSLNLAPRWCVPRVGMECVFVREKAPFRVNPRQGEAMGHGCLLLLCQLSYRYRSSVVNPCPFPGRSRC